MEGFLDIVKTALRRKNKEVEAGLRGINRQTLQRQAERSAIIRQAQGRERQNQGKNRRTALRIHQRRVEIILEITIA